MSDLGFMQQQYDETSESSVVPAGEYPAKIMGCELKDTKAQDRQVHIYDVYYRRYESSRSHCVHQL